MIHRIRYGENVITFHLVYTDRKTLGITVRPDLAVYVRAPRGKSLRAVLDVVKKKAPWILRQISRFEELRPLTTPKEYVSGESFYYLGRQYRLKVIEGWGRESVKMAGGYLQVYVNKRSYDRVKGLMDQWYMSHAKNYYQMKLETCYEKLRKYGIPFPKVIIRTMKTRWGSCSKQHRITLNTQLIKAPSHCIEYVIMHELCHLKYYHHSKSFYSLLNRLMPDWKARKRRLERVVI